MKFFIALSIILVGISASAQDLPGPPANIKLLPAGSYIIAMDNANQTASNGLFNLKTYGLIVHLLNNNIKIKWVIKAGKLKDAADFSVTSVKIKPAANFFPSSRTFRDGPFVIYTADTAGVSALIDSYCNSNGLTGPNYPSIFRNTVAVNVDVRYDLAFFHPHAAVLNDGGNDTIHTHYMEAASIPTSNYNISNGSNLGNGCYTFASEPHNANQGPAVDFAIKSIRKFVMAGGNFLAQCAADSNYENNPFGRFQTTTGIDVPNLNIGTNLAYPNPDLSFSQFEGPFLGYDGYSFIQNWTVRGSFINAENNHTTGTGAFASNMVASEAKLTAGLGSLVFYIGVHSFTNAGFVAQVPVQMNNGIRMYMNAFLTPGNLVCGLILPVTFTDFSGSLNNNNVQLKWSVQENEIANYFDVEESMDGINFTGIARKPGTYHPGGETYAMNNLKTDLHSGYYRIRVMHFNGSVYYSKVILLKDDHQVGDNSIIILGSNTSNAINFVYQAPNTGSTAVAVYNAQGSMLYSANKYFVQGVNTLTIPLDAASHGLYILEIKQDLNRAVSKFIMQ